MKASKQLADAISVLACVFLLAAILTILMDVPFFSIPLQMAVLYTVHLLAGWYLFASEMITRVEFPRAFWVKCALGLLLVSVCLDVILRALRRRESKGTGRWRLKWSFGIAGMLMVFFGIGMSIYGAMAAMKWIGNGKLSAHDGDRLSAHVLYHLGAKYAKKSPATLHDNLTDMLSAGKDMSTWQRRSALFPAASVWEAPEYWTWLGGVPLEGPEDVPIGFAPRLNKDGTRIVLFRNGMTEDCTEEEWQAALERWRQAVRSGDEKRATEASR